MPIYETNFTWTQDNSRIYLTIPTAGCEKKRLDVFSTDSYLKVNFPPKITEIFFKYEINSKKSVANMSGNEIRFILEKKNDQMWECLQRTEIDELTKSECIAERKLQIEQSHSLFEEEKSSKELRKKSAIKQQIALERENKIKLENAKKFAEKEALFDLFQQKPMQIMQKAPKHKTTPIREKCVVKVQFTEWDLTRPARESQKWEKNLVPENTGELRNSSKPNQLRDETEVKELKQQAADLYNGGDYSSAIDAYSKIIEKDPSSWSFFSNRASCHLRLDNYQQAIDDINEALLLIEENPCTELHNKMKCHVKRGTAYCGLGQFAEGLRDYESALKMNVTDEKLKTDVDKLRQMVNKINLEERAGIHYQTI